MPLSNSEAQVWKSHNFSITADAGDEPGAVIFRLVGPFTARADGAGDIRIAAGLTIRNRQQ